MFTTTMEDTIPASSISQGHTVSWTRRFKYVLSYVTFSRLTNVMFPQAMASLTYLQPHVEEIHARAEALDVPTPVVDALRDVLIGKHVTLPINHAAHLINTTLADPQS